MHPILDWPEIQANVFFHQTWTFSRSKCNSKDFLSLTQPPMMNFHFALGSWSLASSCTRETVGSEQPERNNNNFTVGKLVFIFIINGKYNIHK